MVIIVFRSRLKKNADIPGLVRLGSAIYQTATRMPGYVSYKDFTAEDGENVSIVEFESAETLRAWREHPDHLDAQRRGREEFFESYRIQVCTPGRSYSFPDP